MTIQIESTPRQRVTRQRRHNYIAPTEHTEYINVREWVARLQAGQFSLNNPDLAAFTVLSGDGLELSYAVIIAAEQVEPYQTCSAVDPSAASGPYSYHLRVFNLYPYCTDFCRTIKIVCTGDEPITIGANPMTKVERQRYAGAVI